MPAATRHCHSQNRRPAVQRGRATVDLDHHGRGAAITAGRLQEPALDAAAIDLVPALHGGHGHHIRPRIAHQVRDGSGVEVPGDRCARDPGPAGAVDPGPAGRRHVHDRHVPWALAATEDDGQPDPVPTATPDGRVTGMLARGQSLHPAVIAMDAP